MMKVTTNKLLSEVVIDIEDGCVIKLTQRNIEEVSSSYDFDKHTLTVSITLKNGLSFTTKVDNDSELLEELSTLFIY